MVSPVTPPYVPVEMACRRCSTTFTRTYPSQRLCEQCRVSPTPRNHDDPAKARARELRRNYGITVEEYDRLFKKQRGRCAICKQPEHTVGGRNGRTPLHLAVDHDHTNGAIRALLCRDCNHGIGVFKHDVRLLQAAIEYLRQPRLM